MAFEDSEEGVASSQEEAGDTRSPCRGKEAWRDLDLRDGGGFSAAEALGGVGADRGSHNEGLAPSSKGPGHYLEGRGEPCNRLGLGSALGGEPSSPGFSAKPVVMSGSA